MVFVSFLETKNMFHRLGADISKIMDYNARTKLPLIGANKAKL
jgi:hypothetical protein